MISNDAILGLILSSKVAETGKGAKALVHAALPERYICQNGFGDILIYSTVGAKDIVVKADSQIQSAYANMIRRVEG